MSHRFAIYFAPARGSALDERAEAWLAQPDLEPLTRSARRYGFHATLKAPMRLSRSGDALADAIEAFAERTPPITLAGLAPRLIDGFLALTVNPQGPALNDFAAAVVTRFEPFRAPLSADERARRLAAPLTVRQRELVDLYGYPYVLEEFQFHMTLTDRLPAAQQAEVLERARRWFGPVLAGTISLDRLVVFEEPEPGAAFVRGIEFELSGSHE